MFQGSKHVAKAEHIALVQAAGGTMNGSTWLDRTNYFETLPAHQLELGLWLEADRMATLPDALSQENLDNQREVVKNEKRSSYDNRPYGSWQEKLQGHLFPPDHPYHHPTIGSMADLDAASLEDVIAFFRTYYAPNNAVLSIVGDVDTAEALAAAERYFGAIPANPSIPPLGDLSLPPILGGRGPRDRPRPRPAAARLRRVPGAGLRRPAARRARHGQPDPRGREGEPAGPPARAHGAHRPGRGAVQPRVHRRRLDRRRLGDRPAGHRSGARRGGLPRGARPPDHRARHRRRAGPRPRARRGRRARLPPAGRGAGRPAVDVRDPVRRPGHDQRDAAALPGGHAGGDPGRRHRCLPRRQPARPDLPARTDRRPTTRRSTSAESEEDAA